MDKYTYNGPVLFFGKFVGNWKGETMASSKTEAGKNLTYQCKSKFLKMGAGASGIALDGRKIVKV